MDGAKLGDNSLLDIDRNEVEQYLEELANKKRGIDEKTGELRARIKEVIESTGWNKKALSDIRKIDAMSDTARADYLRTFLPMLDVMDAAHWKDERVDMLGDPTDNID